MWDDAETDIVEHFTARERAYVSQKAVANQRERVFRYCKLYRTPKPNIHAVFSARG